MNPFEYGKSFQGKSFPKRIGTLPTQPKDRGGGGGWAKGAPLYPWYTKIARPNRDNDLYTLTWEVMWKKLSYHLEGISYQCCIHFLRNIDHFKINCNGENLKVLCSNITEKIHWAEDVKELIENETKLTYDIKVHTAGEIKAKRESLPKLGLCQKQWRSMWSW